MFAVEYSQTQEFEGAHNYVIRGRVPGAQFDTETETVEYITESVQKKAAAVKGHVTVTVVGRNYFEWESAGVHVREQFDWIEL